MAIGGPNLMQTEHLPRVIALFVFALSMLTAGCNGAASAPSGTPGVPADARYDAGPFTVDAGQEIVMCTYVRGTNDADEDVALFETEQSEGGHHLIVYTVDHAIDLPPSPCSQGGQP